MDKKFLMTISGKEFIKFEGLLSEFHSNGGTSIETIELETSTEDHPKFKAVVIGDKGSFTGHGDADATNVNGMIQAHKYRMAETRAIARALRWYTNVGMCSVDELGGDSEIKQPPRPDRIELASRIKRYLNKTEFTEEEAKEVILTKSGIQIPVETKLKDLLSDNKEIKVILDAWL